MLLNEKLFKKLNDQIEINKIVNEEVKEEEIKEVEEKVIFENLNNNRIKNLDFKEE